MDSVNTSVELTGGNGTLSEGFDTVEDLAAIPAGYDALVWTNRIDEVNPTTVR